MTRPQSITFRYGLKITKPTQVTGISHTGKLFIYIKKKIYTNKHFMDEKQNSLLLLEKESDIYERLRSRRY